MRSRVARSVRRRGRIQFPFPPSRTCGLPRRRSIVRLVAWCEALDEAGPDRIIRVHRGTRVQTERADRLLLHLFQHQIHHRGQAHAMLSSTAVPPPQLDEFFSVAEAPLRAAEFDELGWTEATIWQE